MEAKRKCLSLMLRSFGLGAIVLSLLVLPPSAHAGPGGKKSQAVTSSGSATCVSTTIDTNGDGHPADFCPFEADSNLGPNNGQVVLEFAPLSAPVTCPAGNLELTLVVGSGFKRFKRFGHEGGDLLYLQYTSGTVCVDLTTGAASFNMKADFTGGTGRFAGVTGSYDETATGTIQIADAAGHTFIALTYDLLGTITLP